MKPRLLDLFEERVMRSDRAHECWGWAGAKNNFGYAQLWYGERNMVYVRRDGRRWCAACQRERWSPAARKEAVA